jgi:hypothetical protein
MTTHHIAQHEEAWLLLPWLANGALRGGDRGWVEEHVRGCVACANELEAQRRVCAVLTEPERVSYAPGPSFRKLLERIDANGTGRAPLPARRTAAAAAATAAARSARRAAYAWRPPGLAWAATFVLAVGLGAATVTAYYWSQPRYATFTSPASVTPGTLHIAFDRTIAVSEAEDALRAAGARVITGPDASGIFGVAPVAGGVAQLPALAMRLRGDARVRWVEPLPER